MILVTTINGGRFTGAYLERTQMIGILKALRLWEEYPWIFLLTMPVPCLFSWLLGQWNRNSNSVAPEIFWNNQTQSWNYYVDQAPVYLSGVYRIAKRTPCSICFLVLLIPSYIITKFHRSKQFVSTNRLFGRSHHKETTLYKESLLVDHCPHQSSSLSLRFIRLRAFHYYLT
jgi:hypothetical protein